MAGGTLVLFPSKLGNEVPEKTYKIYEAESKAYGKGRLKVRAKRERQARTMARRKSLAWRRRKKH